MYKDPKNYPSKNNVAIADSSAKINLAKNPPQKWPKS